MSEHTLVVSVYKTILRRNLLPASMPASPSLIVGVSGGTDSLALLHILGALRDRLSLKLHVATLDHGLRGEAGAADAQFVVEMAQAWGLPVTADRADVPTLAEKQQIGIEAAARLARYNFLASVAHQVGVSHVAVAHNADDQAETVLLHLLRGSGLTGLSGMAYRSALPDHPALTLIRPLLDIPRSDLDAYCREVGLHPRHDASNDDTAYTRNRLRRETLPYLRQLSPHIDRNLLQLADIAAQEDDFIDSALHNAIDTYVRREEGRISLRKDVFFNMHPALQKRFIIWAALLCGEESEPSYQRVNAAYELALRGKVGARSEFRGSVQLRNDYWWVIIEQKNVPVSDGLPLLPADAVFQVIVPGMTPIDDNWTFVVSLSPEEGETAQLALPLESEIVMRGRRKGDHFRTVYMYGNSGWRSAVHTKKLTEWMIDHQIPRQLRERIPLLEVDEQIAAIWWQGWIVSHNFAVTPASERIIHVKLMKDFRNS